MCCDISCAHDKLLTAFGESILLSLAEVCDAVWNSYCKYQTLLFGASGSCLGGVLAAHAPPLILRDTIETEKNFLGVFSGGSCKSGHNRVCLLRTLLHRQIYQQGPFVTVPSKKGAEINMWSVQIIPHLRSTIATLERLNGGPSRQPSPW